MNKGSNNYATIVTLLFVVVVIAPLFPLPFAMLNGGHPWKVEFLFGLSFVIVSLFLWLKKTEIDYFELRPLTQSAVMWIAVLGFISSFWDTSYVATQHFTYVWFGYAVVLFATNLALISKTLKSVPLYALLLTGGLVSLLTVLGYFNVVINPAFEGSFRVTFSKYSEILVVLLPFFIVIGILTKRFQPYLFFRRSYSSRFVFHYRGLR